MNAQNAQQRLHNLQSAVARLEEALAVPAEAPLAIDGTIQRFEFVFELCWKTMKGYLELEASPANLGTPRSVIKAAYAAGWLDDEAAWLDLLDMRNATAHTYREALARDIYRRIGGHMAMLAGLPDRLAALG